MIQLLLCGLTVRPLFQVIKYILGLKVITSQLIHIQQANPNKYYDNTIASFFPTFPYRCFSFLPSNIQLIHIEYKHIFWSQQSCKFLHTHITNSISKKMQIGKHFKNGFLLVHSPFQFKHKHLSLTKQRKDKEIKKEREELERKRKDFEEIKGKWMKEEQEYKVFSEKRKEENLRLIMQQEGLKRDLFKLSIRKDQIQARSNPQITIDKATIIKKYLKCVPFTAGKRLESIQFWKSQARYMNLRFLLELAVDRFFGRSTIQKGIIGNLSRIVFCKKIKFGEQWIMFCIKQPIRLGSRFCYKTSKKSHKSLYHPDNIASSPDEKKFELIIYAISGKYFHLNKFYTEEELKSWIDVSLYTEPVLNKHHRLSVADNLAKINALRALSDESMMGPNLFQEFRKESMKQIKDQFKIISEQAVVNSQNSDLNDDTQDENLSQAASQIEKKGSNQDNTPQKTDENISESQAETPTPNLKTRKSVQIKSWFYIRGKNQSFVCKFNRQFLSGFSSSLFPQKNPLINVVVLKDKKQIYLLQEYIQNTSKKLILDMAVARFKLKMKIKAQLKKCLYYKKEIIDVCEETIMAEEKQISLPCLFVLKKRETSLAHEIYISCDSLASHPQIENGLQIKTLLYRVIKERQEIREEKLIARNSHLKNIKSSSLRNRQSKRKSSSRNPSKMVAIQHQKSSFSATKKPTENWVAFSPEIIQKYKTFMSQHIISIKKRRFIPKQAINRKLFNIIKIQSKFRMILSKKILKNAKEMVKIKCVWRQDLNILITASLISSEKIVKVYFEKVEIGCPEPVQCFQYEMINWDTICDTIESIQHEGTFNNVTQNALQLIKLKIERQTRKRMQQQKQKPERYKRMIQSFLFMLSLRFRARKNIFFIKKMIIKERIFVLLIRRDKHVKSLLQCNLYDMILPKEIHDGKNSESAFSKQKELGSEYGSHKQAARSRPDLDDKIFKYQKIYLMEQYFDNIDNKNIVDQFYIDKGVFLLKPPKTFNIFYVERLSTLDMNSEEFFKEFNIFEKKDLQRINQDRISLNQTDSLKKLIILNNSNLLDSNSSKSPTQTQSKEALINMSKIKARQESKQSSRKQKKTSIEKKEKEIFTFLNSKFLKENLRNSQMLSKKSFGGESTSGKATRQIFQIMNNSHESIVYYSLYKADNVFFYLEFFTVLKTVHQNSYHEELVSLEKYRLYKKQLQEASSNLFYKKLAAWAHENQEKLIRTQQKKQKLEDLLSKKGDSTNNMVTLQFFSALIGANKRFSFEMANSLIFQKQTRTNTLTL